MDLNPPGVRIPPRPIRQEPAPPTPELGLEPFDPVVDPPFFDLALRLAKTPPRFPLSSTTARTAEPTHSGPGARPGALFPQTRPSSVE